jgi:hypothetical protein
MCALANKPLSASHFSLSFDPATNGVGLAIVQLYLEFRRGRMMHQNPTKPLRQVIITGGAGFIGSQISARFLKEKTRVRLLTRNVSAPRAMALAQQGCKVTACDLADAHRIPCPEIGPYACWSLARRLAAALQWYYTSGQLAALLAALCRQPGAMTCMRP